MVMQRVLTHFALHDGVLFLNVSRAPGAQIMVHELAKPLITVRLKMQRVEVKVAIGAMCCYRLWNVTCAECAFDCKRHNLCGIYLCGSPHASGQRIVCR